jgi:hypothetical protein
MGPAINPRSMLIPVNRIAGLTAAMVAPTVTEGGTILAGTGAVITLGPSDQPVLKDPAAVFVALGERGSDLSGGSRAAALLHLREALQDARDFMLHRGDYDAARRRRYALGRLDLSALEPVVRREIPLVVAVERASDIRALLALARELDVSVVVTGGAEAWMVAATSRGPRAGHSTCRTDLPYAFESPRRDPRERGTARPSRRGDHSRRGFAQRLAISRSSPAMRWRRVCPYDDALKAISANPAGSRAGSPAPGRRSRERTRTSSSGAAIHWNSRLPPKRSFIRGVSVPMVSRQTLLRDRYLRFGGKAARAPAYPAPPQP